MVEWDGIWPGWSKGQHRVINKMQLMQQLSWIIPRPTKPKNTNMETFLCQLLWHYIYSLLSCVHSQNLVLKSPKNCQRYWKISQNLSILPKNVKVIKITKKIVKKCWNGQNCQMSSKLSNVVKKLQNLQKILSALSKLASYFGKLILSNFFWVNFQN